MKKQSYYLKICLIVLITLLVISGLSVYAQQIEIVPVAPSSSQQVIEQIPYKTKTVLQPDEIQQKFEQVKQQETVVPVPGQKPSAETVSKFEQFIAGESISAVSTDIRQFGYDLFKDASPAFVPSANVPGRA